MRCSGDVSCSYKKSANDSFEWYYGYDTLKEVFSDYFDASANISLVPMDGDLTKRACRRERKFRPVRGHGQMPLGKDCRD